MSMIMLGWHTKFSVEEHLTVSSYLGPCMLKLKTYKCLILIQ